MNEFVNILVNGIMDAFEEFFEALVLPTKRYTLDAFFVSLVLLAISVASYIFDLFTFVDWYEALTCSILLGIIVLIDTSTRSKIKSNFAKIKNIKEKFNSANNEIEYEEELENESVE